MHPVPGLYVHVPFCPGICSYCDFAVLPDVGRLHGEYLRLVRMEWELRGQSIAWETLYVGGGTPSLLGASGWRSLGAWLPGAPAVLESSSEANPGVLDRECLEAMAEAGIRRISIGVQSLSPGILHSMGRRHDPRQALDAVHLALEAGFAVSVDMMFGYPGQSVAQFLADLVTVLETGVSHLSFYGLTVEPGTLLHQQVAKGLQALPEDYNAFYREGVALLEAYGLKRYEVSNFARPGQESLHNRNYWVRGPYLGIGPGAHSFLGGIRLGNPRKWAAWRDWVLSECPASGQEREELDAYQVALETIWLGLRTRQGVLARQLEELQGWVDWNVVERFVRQGLLLQHSDGLALSGEGWLHLDSLVPQLLLDRNT